MKTISLFTFLTMTWVNVLFLVIALSLGFGFMIYGICLIAAAKYGVGIIITLGAAAWLVGYRYRLLTDYKAYLASLSFVSNTTPIATETITPTPEIKPEN